MTNSKAYYCFYFDSDGNDWDGIRSANIEDLDIKTLEELKKEVEKELSMRCK